MDQEPTGTGQSLGDGHGDSEEPMRRPVIAAAGLSFSYQASGFALGPLDLSLAAGEIFGIVGPNGAGKTTLLQLLNGFLRPHSGLITLHGKPMSVLKARSIARSIAFVPHQAPTTFPYRALEIVLMGRLPHLAPLRSERASDEQAARRAMVDTDTAHLADRYFGELSGGERQRVMIAMALAQQPRVLLLDEPTSHLDIKHVASVFDVLVSLSKRQGLAVAAVLHDLNLASGYCDKLLMMAHGRAEALGRPSDVLSVKNIRRVFETEVSVVKNESTGAPFVFPLRKMG